MQEFRATVVLHEDGSLSIEAANAHDNLMISSKLESMREDGYREGMRETAKKILNNLPLVLEGF